MNSYTPKEYWAGIADAFHSVDARGLAPVLHPDAPGWFNVLIDDLQFRAVKRALAVGNVTGGSRILDLGCGTGRWIRRYEEMGLVATGIDATTGMLQLAVQRGEVDVSAGDMSHLPLPTAQFDCVSDITVLQHIPFAQQPQALAEALRVLKPGGCLILMELICGKGAHIFPRTPRDWIQQVTQSGAKLITWFGQEFLLFDRLFVCAARALPGRNKSHTSAATLPAQPLRDTASVARRIYWNSRHAIAAFSAWSDPAAEKVFPARWATHGVFVFRK